jgi:hypothetical protein
MTALGKVTGMALVLALCMALTWSDAFAQTTKGKGNSKAPDSATTNDLLTAPLFPADTIAKLKFTPDQKKDYDALAKDFNDELKKIASGGSSTGSGTPNTTPPPKGKGTKGAGKGGASPDTPAAKAISLRADYEDKVEKMCTDAQKKTLEDIRLAKAGNPLVGGTPSKK